MKAVYRLLTCIIDRLRAHYHLGIILLVRRTTDQHHNCESQYVRFNEYLDCYRS